MARRRMHVADIKEILVHWDAGEPVSVIARTLGYSRPTVRKYIHAVQRVGLVRGSRRHSEAQWEHLAHAAISQVAQPRPRGVVTAHVAAYHTYIAQRIDTVRVSVLYQRLRDEHHLAASWGSFYRYVRAQWPDRVRRAPRVTVRLDDPPPGNEAQVDFFYVGPWFDPEVQRTRRLYAFLMTLSASRHQFLYPVLAEDLTAWLDAHVAAFAFFGGVPKRLVLLLVVNKRKNWISSAYSCHVLLVHLRIQRRWDFLKIHPRKLRRISSMYHKIRLFVGMIGRLRLLSTTDVQSTIHSSSHFMVSGNGSASGHFLKPLASAPC
jgi:transposase